MPTTTAETTTRPKKTISACLVVFNEEALIERCLKSIQSIADEIIVVHDGDCSDRTLELCRQYTDRIYVRPRAGMCEAHKPFAFSQAEGEWILSIDADEVLSDSLRSSIRTLINDECVDAYEFLWPYSDGTRLLTAGLGFPYRRCLVRVSKAYQLGFPHEPLRTRGKSVRVPLVLEHWPANDTFSWKSTTTKQRKWAKIHAGYMAKNPSVIAAFQTEASQLVSRIQSHYRRLPLLRLPWRVVSLVALQLYAGQWRIGMAGFKIALGVGAYEAMLLYYCSWLARWVDREPMGRTHP